MSIKFSGNNDFNLVLGFFSCYNAVMSAFFSHLCSVDSVWLLPCSGGNFFLICVLIFKAFWCLWSSQILIFCKVLPMHLMVMITFLTFELNFYCRWAVSEVVMRVIWFLVNEIKKSFLKGISCTSYWLFSLLYASFFSFFF